MLSQNLVGDLLKKPYLPTKSDIEQINGLTNPPLVQLKPDDIFIRSCRLASDRVDARFGCFRKEDLPRLLEMIQGAPVLIGHDRRTLGVARFFGGEVKTREGVNWIIPKFYWPKDHSTANDLRIMLDAGVYNEASIAFVYSTPTCSICNSDIRSCSHWPGRDYDEQTCFFYYDDLQRVTEGSLVYRGAVHGTGIEMNEDNEGEEKENRRSLPIKGNIRIKRKGKFYFLSA